MVLAALAVIVVRTRLLGVAAGFANDEAYSAWVYIRGGPREILYGSYIPNNHVLFNLLTWGATRLLGPAEWVYRLWSVVPALAAWGIAVAWAWRCLGTGVAVALAVLLTLSPIHLELAAQARGYGLTFLAGALLLVSAASIVGDERSRWAFAWFGAAGLVGVATLPVFALPFLGEAVVIACSPAARRRTAAVTCAVGLVALLIYLPLLSDLRAAASQVFGARVTAWSILSGPCRDLLCPTADLVGVDPRGWLALAVFWVVVALAARRLWRTREVWLLAILAVPVVATYAVLAALGIYAVERFFSELLFHVCVLAALGVEELLDALPGVRLARVVAATALVALASAAMMAQWRRAGDQAATDMEGYREAVAQVRAGGMPRLVVNSSLRAGFLHYASPLAVEFPSRSELERLLCAAPGPFAFVDYPLHGGPVERSCLDERGAEMIPIPQRAGEPDERMRVYLVR
jgi:hypothetical protein